MRWPTFSTMMNQFSRGTRTSDADPQNRFDSKRSRKLRSRETMSRPSVRVGLCEWLAGKPVCYGANKVRAIEQILVLAAQHVSRRRKRIYMRDALVELDEFVTSKLAPIVGAHGREAMNAFISDSENPTSRRKRRIPTKSTVACP